MTILGNLGPLVAKPLGIEEVGAREIGVSSPKGNVLAENLMSFAHFAMICLH